LSLFSKITYCLGTREGVSLGASHGIYEGEKPVFSFASILNYPVGSKDTALLGVPKSLNQESRLLNSYEQPSIAAGIQINSKGMLSSKAPIDPEYPSISPQQSISEKKK